MTGQRDAWLAQGIFQDLEADGAMILSTSDGEQRIIAEGGAFGVA